MWSETDCSTCYPIWLCISEYMQTGVSTMPGYETCTRRLGGLGACFGMLQERRSSRSPSGGQATVCSRWKFWEMDRFFQLSLQFIPVLPHRSIIWIFVLFRSLFCLICGGAENGRAISRNIASCLKIRSCLNERPQWRRNIAMAFALKGLWFDRKLTGGRHTRD